MNLKKNNKTKIDKADFHILVVKNRAMGDSLIGLSSISYLRSVFPRAKITYALPAWITPLYHYTQTSADQFYPLKWKKFKDLWNFFNFLRKESVMVIIELHQAGTSGRWLRLFSKILRISYFYHNHNLPTLAPKKKDFIWQQGLRAPSIQRDLNAVWSVSQYLLGTPLPIPHFLQFPPQISPIDHAPLPQRPKNFIILGVVATRTTKQWPLESFLKLVTLLLQQDPSLHFLIPLSNSLADGSIKQQMLAQNFPVNCQFLQSDLSLLPQYLHEARLYIGNDTGLKHLCAALKIATVTFFGPEEPLEWHPYPQDQHPYFFIEPLACRTRTAHFCGLQTCESMICLKDITVSSVLHTCLGLLKNKSFL